MKYSIEGDTLPVVICELEKGEAMVSENGGRSWALGEITTETTSGGGMKKMLGRAFSGESLFLSRYEAQSNATIAFASSFPGCIIAKELQTGESVIAQKTAFLAATEGVELSTFFQKKGTAGFFGGEGFIMQKLQGPGTVFFEIDGSTKTYDLAAGERLVCDTGLVALMDETCKLEIVAVKGLKNKLLGGEGFFDTVVTGPGKVTVQTMTLGGFAQSILPFMSSK
ncbi:TIGR00266 family protein [Carnobacterium maltaromaticum]|uniref:TIGR00266 family protein n=1 Tax=Carnobacterium maltaromaticum TaxID=2751 RepID=UPI00165AA26F|nr:TIGR00266 family protein [Carnobacterium maltaromaticum]MBC9789603.1 TIGR00266 family protein [Carnobacterium maltaromaticum]